MSQNYTLDNAAYVERRLLDADEAEARIDAISAQAARRFMAIEEAVRRVRALDQLNRSCTLTRRNLSECFDEIVRSLEEANRVRATDEQIDTDGQAEMHSNEQTEETH